MEKLKNTQGIKTIIMKPTAYTKCQIGQDWYRNELEIEMIPGECYPDYMQINEFVMTQVDGKELNIEDVVDILYGLIQREFHPEYLKVTDYIKGCKTHFDVVVIKE